MALLDNEKSILPLSSIAELLNAKVRTLKMYEEKGLFPKHDKQVKKLYSISDIRIIAFVYYLASVKKVNANGIKYILDMLENNMSKKNRDEFLNYVEKKWKNSQELESKDTE